MHVHLYFCGDYSPLNKASNMNEKWFRILAIVATCTAVMMYVSYIPQIEMNLKGQKGTPIQPLCAAINCTLWVIYGLFKKPNRDWPVTLANAPGVILGLITFFTSLGSSAFNVIAESHSYIARRDLLRRAMRF